MKKVLVFAGTTEGRKICERFIANQIPVEACVASEYGEDVLPESEFLKIRVGRIDREGIEQLLTSEAYDLVIDSTHPYAAVVTDNVSRACSNCNVPYIRVVRKTNEEESGQVIYVDTMEDAAEYLNEHEGNALLTTGSKLVEPYTKVKDFENRLYLRVLPTVDAMESCKKFGFFGKHLIGMQGPFSVAMNIAMLSEYNAKYLVTKESGSIGGFLEKLEAAKQVGAKVIVIRRPSAEEGISLEEMLERIDVIR